MQPHPRRSPLGALALLLSLAALALAGWAFWSGSQARGEAASRAELRQLRAQVDSLRAQVSAPDTVALPADSVPAAGAPVNPSTRIPTPR